MAGTQVADGIINPPIDELLDVVDSKYRLVIMAAKRARQINAYYSQLGEGLLEYVGPLVETRSQEKPLSISLREIKERLLNVEVIEADAPDASPRQACRRRPASSSASARASRLTRPASCSGC